MTALRVGLMPGSARSASLHRKLAHVLADLVREHGIVAELIDLAGYPMPIYDGDLEATDGPPDAAEELHDLLATLDGLVFVTPEHNGGPSALLKNTIDWITRIDRAVFKPLLIGLAAASPGSRGAVTGLGSMQRLVEHMRLDLAPTLLSIPHAADAFEIDGERVVLARPDDRERAERFVADYVDLLRAR